jgi:GTP-binding protein LepA
MKHIRNFCIIAHIDHGKYACRPLTGATQTVTAREEKAQLLDNMDLERERGITIKSHAIQMEYTYKGQEYILNLIDTQVTSIFVRSFSIYCGRGTFDCRCCAKHTTQTISNLYLLENDLEIIPVLNKVDLPSANPEK